MTLDLLSALVAFALVTVITPGPNNFMLMASGANFGFRRTLPHMLGVGLGFPAMCFCVGLGVMRLFDLWPPLYTILTVLSVGYMFYLAWKIANASAPEKSAVTGKPLTFFEAASFQWVNPKAWSMALSAITLYAPGRSMGAVLWVVGVYVACSVISTSTWTAIGTTLRRFLQEGRRLKMFNWTMAALLVASLIPVILR